MESFFKKMAQGQMSQSDMHVVNRKGNGVGIDFPQKNVMFAVDQIGSGHVTPKLVSPIQQSIIQAKSAIANNGKKSRKRRAQSSSSHSSSKRRRVKKTKKKRRKGKKGRKKRKKRGKKRSTKKGKSKRKRKGKKKKDTLDF